MPLWRTRTGSMPPRCCWCMPWPPAPHSSSGISCPAAVLRRPSSWQGLAQWKMMRGPLQNHPQKLWLVSITLAHSASGVVSTGTWVHYNPFRPLMVHGYNFYNNLTSPLRLTVFISFFSDLVQAVLVPSLLFRLKHSEIYFFKIWHCWAYQFKVYQHVWIHT